VQTAPKMTPADPVPAPYVPDVVQQYVAHTEAGVSLRQMAKLLRCHPSTVLRRIRRVEQMRDCPLFDAGLRAYEEELKPQAPQLRCRVEKELRRMSGARPNPSALRRPPNFQNEARRVLRRLCETGAVLAVAADMDMAVVVRESATGETTRTAVVSQHVAQGLALEGWISTDKPGRIMRYTITHAGRAALKGFLARDEPQPARPSRQAELAEAPATFDAAPLGWAGPGGSDCPDGARTLRYNLSESPLIALSRRKDKNGDAFLSGDLVRCGERLREDFELAQMGPQLAKDWDRILAGPVESADLPAARGFGPEAAKARVIAAMRDMGPGLSDVAIRCCCYLEGLESAEQRMGWSARSGKIVLRIALQRLKRHYDDTLTVESELIG